MQNQGMFPTSVQILFSTSLYMKGWENRCESRVKSSADRKALRSLLFVSIFARGLVFNHRIHDQNAAFYLMHSYALFRLLHIMSMLSHQGLNLNRRMAVRWPVAASLDNASIWKKSSCGEKGPSLTFLYFGLVFSESSSCWERSLDFSFKWQTFRSNTFLTGQGLKSLSRSRRMPVSTTLLFASDSSAWWIWDDWWRIQELI